MAGKISEMDPAAALAGTERIECLQSADNLYTTPALILAYLRVLLTDTDVPATIVTVSGTSKTLALSDRGQWQDWTNAAAKELTVNTDVGGASGEYHIYNAGETGDLTITATGVTIIPPLGGTLVIPPGGVCTLKWRATNSLKLFGETEAA